MLSLAVLINTKFLVQLIVSRGGFKEISRGATAWLVKPAPTLVE